MDLKQFIDHAFEKYEESAKLIDFKEELLTNLQDRLNSLEATGLNRSEALNEIKTEFADINQIADDMSLAKKKEVFVVQYMSLRHFVKKPIAAIFNILCVLAIYGFYYVIICYIESDLLDDYTTVYKF